MNALSLHHLKSAIAYTTAEINPKSKIIFLLVDQILKNLSCFTSHPKYNGLLGGISFSSFLTCSIIFVPFVYNNVVRSRIRFWIKWTFFPITFGNIFSFRFFVIESKSWSVSSRVDYISNFFATTHRVHENFPRFDGPFFLSHTHH